MLYFSRKCIPILFTTFVSTIGMANTIEVNHAKIIDAKKTFIDELVVKDHFDREQLNHLLFSLKPNEKIIKTITQPFEKQPWAYYRHYFLTPERITLGAQYLKKHHHELMQMQKKYGVPASIITAIIGIETEYGLHLGKYSVLDALYTLGFYYPPREHFFRKELAEYLILARDNHLPLKSMKGSYAGALGIPQFMPSSYRHYGVSTESNGYVNLFSNNDAIASVANYFHKNGWRANEPVTYQLESKPESLQKPASLVTLPLKKGSEYWATYPNFKVIMSYNHNVVYAMVVHQLSQAIEKEYEANS